MPTASLSLNQKFPNSCHQLDIYRQPDPCQRPDLPLTSCVPTHALKWSLAKVLTHAVGQTSGQPMSYAIYNGHLLLCCQSLAQSIISWLSYHPPPDLAADFLPLPNWLVAYGPLLTMTGKGTVLFVCMYVRVCLLKPLMQSIPDLTRSQSRNLRSHSRRSGEGST